MKAIVPPKKDCSISAVGKGYMLWMGPCHEMFAAIPDDPLFVELCEPKPIPPELITYLTCVCIYARSILLAQKSSPNRWKLYPSKRQPTTPVVLVPDLLISPNKQVAM
ncbi:uncharacterized protein CLUP02_13542 [Colletotrichum lupini]|uniref:Uncharacterized protein n=1 Tax=Colletotrichum lupini TaxID=145971 RepID=A0A9Q8T2V9_9PEZI|nr:uncharacterized protein CLUP02_13542 [Colletotrichum lupini]UQC88020.1 hypothetical protein CLUP02_13542 [Colletotrichum lupini]